MIGRKRRRNEEDEAMLRPVRQLLAEAVSKETEIRSMRRRSSGSFTPSKARLSFSETTKTEAGNDRMNATETGPVAYEDINAKSQFTTAELIMHAQQKPSSVEDFMSRLATFDLIRWSSKPDCIASFHCARFGWQLCSDVDALVCVSCHEMIHFSRKSTTIPGFNVDAKLREAIESTRHGPSCPWKTSYCAVTILSLPKDFEMLNFLNRGINSYSPYLSNLEFEDHYEALMEQLSMDWLAQVAGLKYIASNEDPETILNSQKILRFLLLNGWSLEAANISDGLHCDRCLREIPLWMYSSCQERVKEFDIVPGTTKKGGTKKLDPVNNHYWWCPWRRFLEFSEATVLQDNVHVEDQYSVFEESKCLRNKAEAEDYIRMKQLMMKECSKANLGTVKLLCPRLVTSVTCIMDELAGPCEDDGSIADGSGRSMCEAVSPESVVGVSGNKVQVELPKETPSAPEDIEGCETLRGDDNHFRDKVIVFEETASRTIVSSSSDLGLKNCSCSESTVML